MLRGENIVLRALEPSDLELVYQWENNTNIWKVSQTISPFSRHTLSQYLANAHQDIFTAKQLRLMIELNNNSKRYGSSNGLIQKHMKKLGYKQLIKTWPDIVFRKT